MKSKLTLALVAPFVLLAGCEDDATDSTPVTGGKAEGEVLGGTISDDMLPLEQLTSTSPPMQAPTGDAGATIDQGRGGETDSPAPDTDEAETSEEVPAPDNVSAE